MTTKGKNRRVKIVRAFAVAVTSALMLGCIPQPEDETDATNEGEEEAVPWTDGLTTEQVIKAMPIVVDEVQSDDAVASAAYALTAASGGEDVSDSVQKEVMVTWALPKGWLPFADWKVYEGTDDQTWQAIKVDIVKSEDALEIDSYSFKYLCFFTLEQHIKYFKIEMVDHNGDTYSNIVSFMVWPLSNSIQITLSDETEASASSDISIMLNGGWDTMWNYTSATELPLTEQYPTAGKEIPPWTSVRFQIETDFTDWGFEDDFSTHVSNSSFCKVTKVAGYPKGDVQSRLKYSFEDLPLDQVGNEPSKEFDYNDVVLYVDIMKL